MEEWEDHILNIFQVFVIMCKVEIEDGMGEREM